MKFSKKVSEIIDSVGNYENGFEDIIELSMGCKFSDTHTTEPNCAVKKAISEGILLDERFNSYYRFKNKAEYVSEQKNKTKSIDYMKQMKLY
ncbi:hypothetical protein D0U04_30175 [Bacillus clarus]|uniref:Ribosome biogenesis GTPase RsgA n=1 Tax=Bacillus clarus TaxID=2338372 RepID=A0A090YBK5_9BACI|nr:hypothetical protein [Bacillus clarus]KFM95227.1 hypothetical protein DJ93_5646 [Bacillus clarus]RFT61558.1 hypothetical protein D0U04_30175 [Bacillus clarus]